MSLREDIEIRRKKMVPITATGASKRNGLGIRTRIINQQKQT